MNFKILLTPHPHLSQKALLRFHTLVLENRVITNLHEFSVLKFFQQVYERFVPCRCKELQRRPGER